MGKASLYECFVAVNKAQKMDRIRKIMKKAYRDTIKMWNPVLPGLFVTNTDILMGTQAQVSAIVCALNAYREQVGTEFSVKEDL